MSWGRRASSTLRLVFCAVLIAGLAVVFPDRNLGFDAALATTPTVTAPSQPTFLLSTAGQDPGDFVLANFNASATLLVSIGFVNPPSGTSFRLAGPASDGDTYNGLTASFGYKFNSSTNRTQFSFTGTQANANSLLSSMTVNTGATSGDITIRVTASVSADRTYYNPINGHFYKVVTDAVVASALADDGTTNPGTGAIDLAESSGNALYGVRGYLATVTSAQEQKFIYSYVSQSDLWLGGTDDYRVLNNRLGTAFASQAAAEGQWYWVSGPERGTRFWYGNTSQVQKWVQASGATPLVGELIDRSAGNIPSARYENWCTGNGGPTLEAADTFELINGRSMGEPNGSSEEFLLDKWNGAPCWNDWGRRNSGSKSYIVEYSENWGSGADARGAFSGANGDYATATVSARVDNVPRNLSVGVGSPAVSGQLTVTWSAPGTGTVSSYLVTSSPGGLTCTTSTLSCSVSGLTGGTSYTFTVQATFSDSSTGTSLASSAATAPGVPGTPTAVTVTPRIGAAEISWSAPTNTGGTSIVDYVLEWSSNGGATWSADSDTSTSTSAVVTSLSACTVHQFRVSATNQTDTGSASTAVSAMVYATGYGQTYNSTDFVLGGVASNSSGTLTLTPDQTAKFGAVWAKQRVNLAQDFCVSAEVNLGASDAGADGLAFVIQPNSTAAGSSGGGLGYAGITPSFVVELDTYQNATDPAGDHVGLMKNGSTSHSDTNWGVAPTDVGNLEDNQWRQLQILWDSSAAVVTVGLDRNYDGDFSDSGETIFSRVSAGLGTLFSASNGVAYWGFTAATGGATNVQQVRSISYTGTGRVNTPPAFSATVSTQTMDVSADARTLTLGFSDDSTDASQWSISAVSSNATVVPNVSANLTTSIVDSTSATLVVKPATGASGTTTISVTISDADGATASLSFVVNVGVVAEPTTTTTTTTSTTTTTVVPVGTTSTLPSSTTTSSVRPRRTTTTTTRPIAITTSSTTTLARPVVPSVTTTIRPSTATTTTRPSGTTSTTSTTSTTVVQRPVVEVVTTTTVAGSPSRTPGEITSTTLPLVQTPTGDQLEREISSRESNIQDLSLPMFVNSELPTASPESPVVIQTSSDKVLDIITVNERVVQVQDSEGYRLAVSATNDEGEPVKVDASGAIIVEHENFITVTGEGFLPNSEAVAWLFSTPRRLGVVPVASDGTFAARLQVGADVPPGDHTTQVNGYTIGGEIRSLNLAVVVVANTEAASPTNEDVARGNPRETLQPYAPQDDPVTSRELAVAATALLSLAAAGATAERRENRRGKLAGVVTKKLKATKVVEEGRGDRSSSWRGFGTATFDKSMAQAPLKVGPFSALFSRVFVDGAWLRAILGVRAAGVWSIGAALAATWSFQTSGYINVPTTWVLCAVLVVAALDAMAGLVAALIITTAAVGFDRIGVAADVRTLLGIWVLLISSPLLAHVIRPLRRARADANLARERFYDYAMMPVFVAFAAGSMVKALNGLSGLDLVESSTVTAVKWTVWAAMILRLAGEDIALALYPKRTLQVQPAKLVSQTRGWGLVSVAVRVGVFLFVAYPFFGINIGTVVAALLTAGPALVKLWEDELPNSERLFYWLPRGFLRFFLLLILGGWLGSWLVGEDATPEVVRGATPWLLVPGAIFGIVELFGRSGKPWRDDGLKHIGGAIFWLIAVLIVAGRLQLF